MVRCWSPLQSLAPLSLAAFFLVCASSSFAEEWKPAISLILAKVSAQRDEIDTLFTCEVVLDNATGKEVTVHTRFSSVLDGLDLVVTTKGGRILAQRPYIWHQSPFEKTKKLVLEQGETKHSLVFPVRDFPKDAKEVKVRLVGTLPKSDYPWILSTDTIETKVKSK